MNTDSESKFPYSVQMREYTDQENSEYRHFMEHFTVRNFNLKKIDKNWDFCIIIFDGEIIFRSKMKQLSRKNYCR